ncbi:hypothetical protein FRB96_002317 [Tulasnella sp. 330]|nr:hypothetical protein FRB96_002317 [Tulasnella sp. 330]
MSQTVEAEAFWKQFSGLPKDPRTPLTSAINPSLEDEVTIRRLFATGRDHKVLKPHTQVNDAGDLTEDVMTLDEKTRRKGGGLAMASAVEDFKARWAIFSEGALSQWMDWTGIIPAGDSVLACLAPLPDKVIIVLRLYQSPAEILAGFDVDSSCVAFDGRHVLAIPRAAMALLTQSDQVATDRRSPSYEVRLTKYAQRDLEIHVPELKHDEFGGLQMNDYDVAFHIPYGPGIDARKIEKLAYREDLGMNSGYITFNPKNKGRNLHRHPAFFGTIQEAIEDCCQFLTGRIAFMKDDPGRQSITGSFHLIDEGRWSEQAYIRPITRLFTSIPAHDRTAVKDFVKKNADSTKWRDHRLEVSLRNHDELYRLAISWEPNSASTFIPREIYNSRRSRECHRYLIDQLRVNVKELKTFIKRIPSSGTPPKGINNQPDYVSILDLSETELSAKRGWEAEAIQLKKQVVAMRNKGMGVKSEPKTKEKACKAKKMPAYYQEAIKKLEQIGVKSWNEIFPDKPSEESRQGN